jgi:hypothetical protein
LPFYYLFSTSVPKFKIFPEGPFSVFSIFAVPLMLQQRSHQI